VDYSHFQVDTDEELRGTQSYLQAADARMSQEKEQPCCYAKSDKYWVADPNGIAWENISYPLQHSQVWRRYRAIQHGESVVPVSSDASALNAAPCIRAAKREAKVDTAAAARDECVVSVTMRVVTRPTCRLCWRSCRPHGCRPRTAPGSLHGESSVNSTALKESIQFPARAENAASVGAKPSEENVIQVDLPSALVQAFVT
jgi:hypothetical protein